MAIIELYTRNAMEGHQFVGMYSRFGWNHPGPTYFYMLVPFYMLGKERSSSLMWGALAINAMFAMLLCLMLSSLAKKDIVFVLCSSLLFAIFLIRMGIDRLATPWNPWAVALPFILFIHASAALSMGKISYLPIVAIVGSLLTQTHVGTAPTVLAVAGVSCVLSTQWSESWHSKKRSICLLVGLTVIALLGMWLLPIIEETRNYPGNLSKVHTFFAQSLSHPPFSDSLYAVAVQLSWFPLALLQKIGLVIPDFERELLSLVFAVVQVAGLVIVVISAGKRGALLRARTCVIGVVAALASLWSVSRIEGDIFSYLVFWISSIGCVNWAVLSAELAEHLKVYMSRHVTTNKGPMKLAVLAASLLLVIVSTSLFLKFPVVQDSPEIRILSQELISYLRDQRITKPVFLFNWSNWTTEASMILQLHKKHIPFATQNLWKRHSGGWPLLLGQDYQPTTESYASISVERESSLHKPEGKIVARFENILVRVKLIDTIGDKNARRARPADTVGKE